MKTTINTETLKEMVTRSVNGASHNKLMPLTMMMGIKYSETTLRLITTDMTNYLYILNDSINSEDFSVTVYVEQFSKLISKMTSEETTLEIKNNTLEVIGNGKYTLELPLDENGELIDFPDPLQSDNYTETDGEIKTSDVRTILDTISVSLATDMSRPVLTNYYVGDSVLAAGVYKIADFSKTLFDTKGKLMSTNLMNLLSVITDAEAEYKIKDDTIIVVASDCAIVGKFADGIDMFPIDKIKIYFDEKFPSSCKLNKKDFLNLLDRISIFVSKYDNRAISLNFDKNGLTVTNKASNSSEKIDYIDSKSFKKFNCYINVDFLAEQIKAYASDVVELHYGSENVIKLVDGSITQIIALNDASGN